MTTFGLHTVNTRLLSSELARELPEDHPHARERGRRVLNVIVAAVGLIVTAPLFALIAVAIKLTDSGPVFYRQRRVGLCLRNTQGGNFRRQVDLGGRPFVIYKFRTMRVAKPGADAQVWASENDPRITKLGRFLRKTRLDELPQLYNVLKGDMNVVGPRPEQPEIFQTLRTEVPSYPIRQRVRPGITGQAQISLHYDTCVEDVKKKVQADLEYIERQSVLTDLRIMLMTVPVVIFRKGGW
ncbi:MAG: sugar transferase [Gemmatimonadaceae bacterium]|nr:sugar transferase [Gemmatimonadaceae bacterium]